MLAALLTAIYILFHVSLGAVFEVVVKDDGDLSCFRPSNYSLSMTIAFLVSFLQVSCIALSSDYNSNSLLVRVQY